MKLVMLIALVFSFNAFSKCEVSYDRTACKGKEKDSYAKCPGGTKTCTVTEGAEDEAECKEAAHKACSNSRTDITKSKIVTAKWNGKEIMSKSGKADFCADYEKRAAEYNKCD